MIKMKQKIGRKVNATGRNTSAERYTNYPHNLVRSAAFRSLGGNALKLLMELCTYHNGYNNGEIGLSLDRAAALLGMGKATAQRAFDELAEKGFIVKTSHGSWYGRKATQWRITFLKGPNSENRTDDWKNYQPEKTQSRSQSGTVAPSDCSATAPKGKSVVPKQNRSGQKHNGSSVLEWPYSSNHTTDGISDAERLKSRKGRPRFISGKQDDDKDVPPEPAA